MKFCNGATGTRDTCVHTRRPQCRLRAAASLDAVQQLRRAGEQREPTALKNNSEGKKSHRQAKAPLHDSNESRARATCPCARVTSLSKVPRKVGHHHLTATSATPNSCHQRGQLPSIHHAQAPPPHRELNATFLTSHHMPPPPPRGQAQVQARSRPSP